MSTTAERNRVGDNENDNDVVYEVNFPFWITVAFTLNYIIGSGFLTLPWAFEQAGILLGIGILLLFGFFSTISVFFILEAMSCAEKLDHFHGENHQSGIQLRQGYFAVKNPVREDEVDTENSTYNDEVVPTVISSQTHLEQHVRRKKEITELCQIFLGDYGKQLYVGIICVYMYGTLWAYTTVFANSFSAAHEKIFGDWSYEVFVLIFSVGVVPLSLMEFSEQVYLQVSLSVFRVFMVIAMVTSIIIAYYSADNQFQLPEGYQEEHDSSVFFRAEWSKIYLLMPVAAYAFIFHHSVPALSEPITDKSTLNSLFQTALVISMVFYIALGVIISAYFGTYTLPSSNLNWKDYTGNGNGITSILISIIRFFVLLFPAVDVASAFPLNAFTLGNNIMTAYYGKDIHHHESSRWKLNVFRSIAAVPPIFGALFIKDLGKITSFTGLTGFALAFIFPPLLSYVAKKKLELLGIRSDTVHSSFWTNVYFQGILFFSGIFLIFYVGYILITTTPSS